MLALGIPKEIVLGIIAQFGCKVFTYIRERTYHVQKWCAAHNHYHHVNENRFETELTHVDGDVESSKSLRLVSKRFAIAYSPLDIYKLIGGIIGRKYTKHIIYIGTRLWFDELKLIAGHSMTRLLLNNSNGSRLISHYYINTHNKVFIDNPLLVFNNRAVGEFIRIWNEEYNQWSKHTLGGHFITKKKYAALDVPYTGGFVTRPNEYHWRDVTDKLDFDSLYPNMMVPYNNRNYTMTSDTGEKVGLMHRSSFNNVNSIKPEIRSGWFEAKMAENYWFDARIQQVLGRAVRLESHVTERQSPLVMLHATPMLGDLDEWLMESNLQEFIENEKRQRKEKELSDKVAIRKLMIRTNKWINRQQNIGPKNVKFSNSQKNVNRHRRLQI